MVRDFRRNGGGGFRADFFEGYSVKIYDRAAGKYIEEKEHGENGLKFLYNTAVGRILLKIFFCRKIYSELNAA